MLGKKQDVSKDKSIPGITHTDPVMKKPTHQADLESTPLKQTQSHRCALIV